MKLLLSTSIVALSLACLPARAETIRSDYSVSLYGLTLARMHFKNTITANGFDVTGSLSSAGIGAIFDDTDGTVSSKGAFSGSAAQPVAYRTDYTSGSKAKMTAVAFSGGNVVSAVNNPPVKTKRKSWVPVRPGDLVGVADPLSAMLVRTGDAKQVCGRTFHIFDGAMRADLKLSYAATKDIAIDGYRGPAVVCNAMLQPISGYRKNFKSLQYLKNSSGITISFAPVGKSGVYAPVAAAIGTEIGTINVRASRFEARP